ncbi:hypothetical protein CHLV4142_08710 [Campylobacter helveticus]|uniref:2-amino-4-hydroxy-6-hydroxymethyldihydropteridine pyrophosphokinase n=1 Tax=Campylobacter helveticus TaxID=28898 RepID=A0ABY3L3K1_9BACT|nr:hypothetical protein [Campylobacter helveticus]MCR2040220.1 hypothetical protein [Campylobacter helveticus]MCR2057120.1 hypothetical protein [Campylobacter helveticus]MCR2060696.1 hypothetical protein [Campylobacter helveticus]QBL12182.1 hypothetical protein A0073_07075 [Campylobacter helveticus]TXK59771.1 hypothetical protein FVD16_01300 [Campylobacter helveticus]
MQGKILADNLIGGNDGNRYSFSLENVRNLNNKTINDIINAEVDFEVDGTEAKSIFITKNSINIGNIMQGDSINSIKTKAYIYVAGVILGVIPFLGWALSLVGFVFMILAILTIGKISGAPLIRNFLLSWILVFVGGIVMSFSVAGSFIGGLSGSSGFTTGMIALIVVGVLICIGGLVFSYFYYRDLAEVTNEKFFLYAFICRAVAALAILVPILGIVLMIAAAVIELIAWIRFKEVRKKEAL